MIRLFFAFCILASAGKVVVGQDRPVDRAKIEALARRIEPKLAGKAERLPQYVTFFRKHMVDEPRLYLFDVQAEPDGDRGATLKGFVELNESRTAVAAYLEALGFAPVKNEIELAPVAALSDKRFGFVKTPHALCYEEPGAGLVATDGFLGEPLLVLREQDGNLLVHCGDGYLGWVRAQDVHRVDAAAFNDYLGSPAVNVHVDCTAKSGMSVPAGARLKFVRAEGNQIVAATPTGEELELPAEACENWTPPAKAIESIIANAQKLLGTEYVWGGKTSEGVDCSGLVQVSYARAGFSLPRDASQQFQVGQLTGTRWWTEGMRRGDTMYFVDPQGHVSHTGIYLGNQEYIHACPPRVTTNSFDPKAKNYHQGRRDGFAFARRPLD